jgi:hypothetical protein
MKKIITLLLIATVVISGMARPSFASVLPENPPVIGEESTTTDFYSHWQPASFGANRVGDQGVVMAMTSGFGLRAGFRTAFDATDFEMQADLTYMDPGTAFITFFGPQGSYIGGNGAYLSIEFVKHTTAANTYLVAVQVGSAAHHVSLPEFVLSEQGDWEDPAWTGYHVVAADNVFTVSIKETDNNVDVVINGQTFTVASSTFYQDFPDKTNAHYLVGAINLDGSIQTVTMNYIVDATRRTYYEDDGVYDSFKTNLELLETALNEDLSVAANVQAAQAINNNLDIDTLYEYDQNYFQDRYDDAVALLDAAILELGGDIVLDDLETAIVSLETKVAAITNQATAELADDQLIITSTKASEVDSTEFTPEQVQRLTDLEARITQAEADLLAEVRTVLNNQLSNFTSATTTLTSINEVNVAIDAKEAVNMGLLSLLPDDEHASFEATYDNANQALLSATNTLDGWTVNDNTYVIVNDDTIEATFMGSGLGEDGNGIFYSLESLDVRNFKMTLSIESITNTAGGWISFGIMENPEIFSTADDSSVQDNKGLFFLIIPEANGRARVEIYLLSLYSNRFFDAQRTDTLNIDITQDVEIVFSTEMRTVSGVSEEYMSISIGGQTMDSDVPTTRSMLTALIENTGYLYVAGTGGNSDSKNTVAIKMINDELPNADSLVADYAPEPYLITSSIEFTKGSTSDANIEVYGRGLDITVKLNGTVVDDTNYTYDANVLKLSAAYLETLDSGDYNVTIETDGGSVSVQLAVEAEEVVETSNGATTIIIIVSSVAVVGGAGAFFFIKKKRLA